MPSGSPGPSASAGSTSPRAGQPGNAAAWEDAACNAACRDFFRNTRRTLETSWLRLRYNGNMQLQDTGGAIVHACLTGDLSEAETIAWLDAAYRKSCA